MAQLVDADADGAAAECLRIIAQIRALDPAYGPLADRVEDRWLKSQRFLVIESTTPERMGIKTPYSPTFVDFCRESRFWWDAQRKVWTFASSHRERVLGSVAEIYGAPDVLTTGLDVIPPSPAVIV
jgi:hypothetical protein